MQNYVHISELKWEHPFPKRLFLEASAGTGKTYTIQHFVVRSILESVRDKAVFHPKSLLVVTFTKAAASELRMRIQETIERAYQIISTSLKEVSEKEPLSSSSLTSFFSEQGFAYLSLYLFSSERESISYGELDRRAWELMYSLKQFLDEIDLAQISTIHSFLHTSLIQFSREREGALSSHHLDAIVKSNWISKFGLIEWIQETLSWSLSEKVVGSIEWSLLLKYYKGEKLVEEIARKLLEESLSNSLTVDTLLEERKKRCNEIQDAFSTWKKRIISETEKSDIEENLLIDWLQTRKGSSLRDGNIKREYSLALYELIALLKEPQYTLQIEQEIALRFEILDPIVQGEAKKRGLPSQIEAKALPHVSLFFTSFWGLLSQFFSYSAIFNRVYKYISALFIQLLQKGQWKTFQSVLEIAYELTNEESFSFFSEALRKQFQVVIIDEFQDTDPLQWAIFKRLFFDTTSLWNGRMLFVGDPKQAIYIFRNADVYTYLEAKKSFQWNEIGALNKNYRSSSEMVSGINRLFSEKDVDQWLFFMPKISSFIQCQQVESQLSAIMPLKNTREGSSIHFACTSVKKGRKRIWPSPEIEEEALFIWIQREITHLLQYEEISLDEIALLVKDRHQAARLELFFRKNGMNSKTVRIDLITESPIFPICIALLKAIEESSNPMRLSELFLSAQTALGIQLAKAIAADLQLQGELLSHLHEMKNTFYSHGIGAMMHLIHERVFLFERSALQLILGLFPFDIQHEIDFNHILEIILNVYELGYRTISQIGDALYHLQMLFQEDPEYLIRRNDTERKRKSLSIMTMHRSKGLEFPVVFILGATSRTREDEDEISDLQLQDIESEKIRLLYVSMTRAKRRLYILAVFEELQKSAPFGSHSPLELFFACHRGSMKQKQMNSSLNWREEIEKPVSLQEAVSTLLSLQEGLYKQEITYSFIQEELLEPSQQINSNFLHDADEEQKALYSQQLDKNIYETRRYLSFSQIQKRRDAISLQKKYRSKGDGKRIGIRFHAAISRWFQTDRREYTSHKELQFFCNWVESQFPTWKDLSEEVAAMLQAALSTSFPLGAEFLSLQDLSFNPLSEKLFLERSEKIPNSYLQGSIDLIFFHERRIYMIDWKSHDIAENEEHIESIIRDSGYDVQADLYSEVAKKYIDKNPQYSFGGFFLIFLSPIVEKREGQVVGFFFHSDSLSSKKCEIILKRSENNDSFLLVTEALKKS